MARPIAPTPTLYGRDARRFKNNLERDKDKKVVISATHADKDVIREHLECLEKYVRK